MNTRLAQIIAASIGPDGRPDPARVYEALRLIPDDPVAIIVEGVLAAQATNAAHEEAMTAQLRRHEDQTVSAAKVIADAVLALRAERQESQKAFADGAAEIHDEATALNRAASMLGARALTAVFVFGLLLGGLLGAVGAFYFQK